MLVAVICVKHAGRLVYNDVRCIYARNVIFFGASRIKCWGSLVNCCCFNRIWVTAFSGSIRRLFSCLKLKWIWSYLGVTGTCWRVAAIDGARHPSFIPCRFALSTASPITFFKRLFSPRLLYLHMWLALLKRSLWRSPKRFVQSKNKTPVLVY